MMHVSCSCKSKGFLENSSAQFGFGYCDWNGLLSAVTNGSGFVVEYMHDIMDRVTNISWRTTSGATLGGFEYEDDAAGRIVSRRQEIGDPSHPSQMSQLSHKNYAYDDLGSLTNETVVGVAGTNTIIRHWDSFGRSLGYSLVGRDDPIAPQRQSTLAYDSATGRLASMEVSNNHSPTPTQNSNPFTWNYLHGSDLKSSLTYPNGLTASWTYDANNQLLQVFNATPTNLISQYDYTYDPVGRRIARDHSGSAFDHGDHIDYGYNARSELTNAVATVDSDYRYTYAFDDIGNRETASERGTNICYSANALNQYTSISNLCDSASLREEFTPQFDDDGNQTLIKTSSGIWAVTYNGENRPIRWENGDSVIVMDYDRLGRRLEKNSQYYGYCGYQQIADNGGNTYVWDPTEKVTTRPLAWRSDSSLSYYLHDSIKNVSEVISLDYNVVAHYEYGPFGTVSFVGGPLATANPWRFSSEYADDETMTVYYNYRNYNPTSGRWLGKRWDASGKHTWHGN